ncbi:M20/M25/M40 family metallo-hydrolase [Pseudoclavibacter chungangensis]|uniref:M20/M25/M40 family metallo-hydrolase n=1 Tax=Pseudoclavibacter chungangensis TaxID=587635 RepID=A0A7J5BZY7_9MICO|nr:M20/M25/M40 family metallo-hydrolase [Pseudoclavibacter chungangensis]KAB1660188.1 M20/M25/M40 family metallo-hydrolase [Pseudoclavibacter chungangensis]NYJ66697.1 acetylornithine deacetylase/succinyl-diaminopimelate desuccinylase-like protein [Pseudoclavibacter chungangensis]
MPETTEPQDHAATTDLETDRTVETTRDLIRIDTTNYGEGRSKGETEAADYLRARLERLGLRVDTFEPEPRRTSIVARVEGRDRSKPALVVHGHTDVVPADPSTWSVDPFAAEVRDGLLWGRGAVDMKNMDAMIITALEDILGAGEQPERDLVIAYFADEENGGVYGANALVKAHPEWFEGATEAISEVGGYSITIGDSRAYLLQTGEKAMMWIKLHARGNSAHGSRVIPADDNVVTRLAKAVAEIGSREWPVKLNRTTETMVAAIAEILGVDPVHTDPETIVLGTGRSAGFLTASLRTTANPTRLDAGYKHNVIPESATVAIDVRPFPGEEDAILDEIRRLAGDGIELEVTWRDIGTEAEPDSPLMRAAAASLHRHDPGAPLIPYFLPAGTDNKSLSKLGITGYGFAPLKLPADLDFPGMFHGVDERVPLDALVFGREVLKDFLRTY